MRAGVVTVVSVLCAARVAAAQPGAIECFAIATAEGLDETMAVRLCVGAESPAPGECYAAATELVPALVNPEAIRLCRGATSLAPAYCLAQLENEGDLERRASVSYCAAQRWPLVPSPEPGVPECVTAALDRTRLTDAEAVWLCRGSRSVAPVDCFVIGDARTFLPDRALIELCTRVVPAPFYPPSYGY